MPKATVAAIVTSKDSNGTKVLLTCRNIEPFKGQWCLPGGHIDEYEAAEKAIVREVKQETGLRFDAEFFRYFDERVPKRDIHAVVMVFAGPGQGVLRPQRSEVSKIGWFSLEEAQAMPLAFTHNEILQAYAARPENVSDRMHSELLAEVSALRTEILHRVEMRQQILTFTLIVAGTMLSLGTQTIVLPGTQKDMAAVVLLVYPLLALFLARSWVQHDVRIAEIARYIETRIEPRCQGIGWETYIHNLHRGKKVRPMELTAAGIFLATQILALVLALPRLSYSSYSLEEIILFVTAVPAVYLTFRSLHRRLGMLKQTEQESNGQSSPSA